MILYTEILNYEKQCEDLLELLNRDEWDFRSQMDGFIQFSLGGLITLQDEKKYFITSYFSGKAIEQIKLTIETLDLILDMYDYLILECKKLLEFCKIFKSGVMIKVIEQQLYMINYILQTVIKTYDKIQDLYSNASSFYERAGRLVLNNHLSLTYKFYSLAALYTKTAETFQESMEYFAPIDNTDKAHDLPLETRGDILYAQAIHLEQKARTENATLMAIWLNLSLDLEEH